MTIGYCRKWCQKAEMENVGLPTISCYRRLSDTCNGIAVPRCDDRGTAASPRRLCKFYQRRFRKIRKQRELSTTTKKKINTENRHYRLCCSGTIATFDIAIKDSNIHLSYHWQELHRARWQRCLNKLNWFQNWGLPDPVWTMKPSIRHWILLYSKRTSRGGWSEKKFTLMLPEPCHRGQLKNLNTVQQLCPI